MSIRQNPIAYLALFIALGGSAYAAVSLPPDSVGTQQLRNGAVTASKLNRRAVTARAISPGSVSANALQDGAVTGAKIATQSLTAAVFAPGTLPAASPQQTLETTTSYAAFGPSSAPFPNPTPAGTTVPVQADCLTGQQATGGGFQIPPDEQSSIEVTSSMPATFPGSTVATGWTVGFTLLQALPPNTVLGVETDVVCTSLK